MMCACAVMLPVEGVEHQGLLEERAVCTRCGRVWQCFSTAEMRATSLLAGAAAAARGPAGLANTPSDQPTTYLPAGGALYPQRGPSPAVPPYMQAREGPPAGNPDPDAPPPPYLTRR